MHRTIGQVGTAALQNIANEISIYKMQTSDTNALDIWTIYGSFAPLVNRVCLPKLSAYSIQMHWTIGQLMF